MYSKRRQPRKQKKSRSGLRKTQRGGIVRFSSNDTPDTVGQSTSSNLLGGVALPKGMSLPDTSKLRSFASNISETLNTGVSNAKDKVSGIHADLQTHQELPSRVDGLQATVAELQQQVADLKENTTTKTEQQNIFNAIIEVLENLKTVTENPSEFNSNSPVMRGLHTKLNTLKDSVRNLTPLA